MDVLRNGWHPKGKDGGKESWRGDYKGINQVAGWVGKGKKPGQGADIQGSSHISRPLATLKDPASFGPPPRNVNYHGGVALPDEITPHTGGIGAPLTSQEMNGARYAVDQHVEEEADVAKPAPPPLPYRSDRTGLKTDNLPPPPVRRDIHGSEDHQQATQPKSTPNLPPRLPSRQNTASSLTSPTSPPPPAYDASPQTKSSGLSMNHSAMNRLGSAGVSVPSLGIGRKNSSNTNTDQDHAASELSSRFKRLNSNVSSNLSNKNHSTTSSPQTTATTPTWAQTQQSLRTAQNFQKDPSTVSLADAQQAAATAQQAHNNAQAFRARHADKIDAAERKATAFNKKYNMTGRLNKFLEDANDEHDQQQQQQQQQAQPPPPPPVHPNVAASTNQLQRVSPPPPVNSPQASLPSQTTAGTGRKPPPPPPPKKPSNLQAPPPVPLGTRPTFS